MIPIVVYFIVKEINFINKSELVKARIMSVEYKESQNEDDAFYYVLSLNRLSGGPLVRDLKFDSPFIDPHYKEGQIVEVYYDSANPYESEIKNAWINWEVPLILGVISIFDLISIGIIYLVFASRKNTETIDTNVPGTGSGISVH